MFPNQNPVCISPLPPYVPHAPPISSPLIDHWNNPWSSSSCTHLHSPVISSPLGPNIGLSLCSSLNETDQVSHPHKRRRKILYILIFIFFGSIQGQPHILDGMAADLYSTLHLELIVIRTPSAGRSAG